MFRFSLIFIIILMVLGCASTTGTFFNRPVVEDSIKEAVSTVSLASDRRTVVVVTEGTNRTKFCAEPPPDTATGLKAELEAALKAKAKIEAMKADYEIDGNLKDRFETIVTVIAERTPPLDAFRTGVYALCQFHLNGAISQAEVKPIFELLIQNFKENDVERNKQK